MLTRLIGHDACRHARSRKTLMATRLGSSLVGIDRSGDRTMVVVATDRVRLLTGWKMLGKWGSGLRLR